jgi:hypothetical protein
LIALQERVALTVARLRVWCSRLGANLHRAAGNKVDRGIEDDLISCFDSGVHFYARPEIALHSHLADFHLAIANDRHLNSIAIEDDGIGRD